MTIPLDFLRAAVNRMLEEMYFCEAEWVGPGLFAPPTDGVIGARVAFSGTLSGEFRVAASTRLAVQLTADFLAADPSEITAEQRVSLVHEFANVVCGATLSEWMPEATFHYSVPAGMTPEELAEEWPHRFSIAGGETELAVDLRLLQA